MQKHDIHLEINQVFTFLLACSNPSCTQALGMFGRDRFEGEPPKSLSRKHERAEELWLAGGHGASAGSDLDSGIYGGGAADAGGRAQCGTPERTWGELNMR